MTRKRRIIFTADDFGLAVPVNEAVERAHRDGLLRCASLMVGAAASDDAVERAHNMPSLRVGLHVVLVNGRPVLPADEVPALVDAWGRFRSNLVGAGVHYFASYAARKQLRQEIRAQFAAFAATGLPLDHVNAQNHFHVHPTVFGMILDVGREFGMRAVRIPREPFGPSWRAMRTRRVARFANATLLSPWLSLMAHRTRRAGLVCNDFLFGMNDTGRMTPDVVRRIVAELPPGISEIYLHPATASWPEGEAEMPGYRFADELGSLLDAGVNEALNTRGAVKTTFTDLADERAA